MKYLMEHEYGFDPDGMGFPSISGCHAIVYLTENGLFGFHNAGGSGDGDWATRAQGFAAFVNEHFLGKAKGLALYGASFVADGRRGYSLSIGAKQKSRSAKAGWKLELKEFANALGFSGSIKGYDLSTRGIQEPASAYVEYRRAGKTCNIYVQPWTDAGMQRSPIASRLNHKKRVGQALTSIVTTVNSANLQIVAPEKI